MTDLIVYPQALRVEVLLTALSPISHHDPAVQDESNRQVFNREGKLLSYPVEGKFASAEQRGLIAAAHPVPQDIVSIVEQLSFEEFLGVCLLRLFMDIYNSAEGTGLFAGMERYRFLETRAMQAAISAPTLRVWWNTLCNALRVPVHSQKHDIALLDLLSVPIGTQQAVLKLLAQNARSLMAIARLWHSTEKLGSEEYARQAGQMAMVQPHVTLSFENAGSERGREPRRVEIPAVSANSLRHEMVREPAWLHLCHRLGLEPSEPGRGPVPEGVEAIFVNGGNIMAGAKAPANTFTPSWQIRRAFPSLDLLGGVTDSFDIGESALKVGAWLVCRENAEALPPHLANTTVSAFDMLDDITLTRQGESKALGQMIWGFETLVPGSQVLVRFTLSPYTAPLTRGALYAALRWYEANDATIGGQAARGFGHVALEWLEHSEPQASRDAVEGAYERYLADNREQLLEWLTTGTLGADRVVCAVQ